MHSNSEYSWMVSKATVNCIHLAVTSSCGVTPTCPHPLLRHRAQIVVTSNIVPPPLRKRNRRASSSKYRKRQDKQASQTRAIKGTRNKVRVVLKDAGPVVTQVELREETHNRPTEKHASLTLVVRNVSRVLNELREVDLAEGEVTDLGHEAHEDAMSEDDGGTDEEAKGNDGVGLSLLVQVRGERPGGGVGVVGLDGCATPRRVAVGVSEEVLVSCYDGDHDGVVDEAAEDCAVDLCHEHDARRNLEVFA